jgi:hypothetical protein
MTLIDLKHEIIEQTMMVTPVEWYVAMSVLNRPNPSTLHVAICFSVHAAQDK